MPRFKLNHRQFWPTLIIGATAVTFAGCELSQTTPDDKIPYQFVGQQSALQAPQSCDQLAGLVVENFLHPFFQEVFTEASNMGKGDAFAETGAIPPDGPGAGNESSHGGSSPTFTGTNNHEAAADESDWVKTDGNYIYSITRTGIAISKSWEPGDFKVVKEINLSSFFRKADGSALPALEGLFKQQLSGVVDLALKENRLYVMINTSGYRPTSMNSFLPNGFGGGSMSDDDFGEKFVEGGKDGSRPPTADGEDFAGSNSAPGAPENSNSGEDPKGGDNNSQGGGVKEPGDGGKEEPSPGDGGGKGQWESFYSFRDLMNDAQISGSTRVVVLDISDRTNPSIVEAIDFDSDYRDGRGLSSGNYMIHDLSLGERSVYEFVRGDQALTSKFMELEKLMRRAARQGSRKRRSDTGKKMTLEEFRAERNSILAQIRTDLTAKFTGSHLEQHLPQYVRYNSDLAVVGSPSRIVECSDVYVSNSSLEYGGFAISRLPSQANEQVQSIAASGQFNNIYANGTNLYVDQTYWSYPTYESINDWDPTPQTVVHKFVLNSANSVKPSYVANGKIKGSVHNQYSMNEHNGLLRVATSGIVFGGRFARTEVAEDGEGVASNKMAPPPPSDDAGSSEDNNNQNSGTGPQPGQGTQTPEPAQGSLVNVAYVLEQVGTELQIKGETKPFGVNESIRSARFIGDKGYIVTFERKDPFFVFDFSDPAHPAKKGELDLYGYSAYLHPLDANHIIGLGFPGDQNGADESSLQLVIFDVSNPQTPTTAHTLKLESSFNVSSGAVYDFHSFTFDPKSKILSIPLTARSKADYKIAKSGFQYYKVDATSGISHLGEVNQHELLNQECQKADADQLLCNRYQDRIGGGRSIIMSEQNSSTDFYIYTITSFGIFQQKTSDLNAVIPKFF